MMTKYRSKFFHPTKIADIPVSDFDKKELLILLNATIWALNHKDSIYSGLLMSRVDQTLFDPDFIVDLRDVKGYYTLINIIRIIATRLVFIG